MHTACSDKIKMQLASLYIHEIPGDLLLPRMSHIQQHNKEGGSERGVVDWAVRSNPFVRLGKGGVEEGDLEDAFRHRKLGGLFVVMARR